MHRFAVVQEQTIYWADQSTDVVHESGTGHEYRVQACYLFVYSWGVEKECECLGHTNNSAHTQHKQRVIS